MPLGPFVPFFAVAMLASITGMVHGAGRGDTQFTALAALAFIVVVVGIAIVLNVQAWASKPPANKVEKTGVTVRLNAYLAALLYGWGAASMFAVYSLSDLSWRHSWQYGLGMAIFAIGIAGYTYLLDNKKPPALPPLFLTLLHGGAAITALAYLIGTGKLQTIKSDWAANEVFLWGGSGIVILCILSLITQLLHNRVPASSNPSA